MSARAAAAPDIGDVNRAYARLSRSRPGVSPSLGALGVVAHDAELVAFGIGEGDPPRTGAVLPAMVGELDRTVVEQPGQLLVTPS